MWSRKPIPVLMSYLPVPSRLMAAAMRVSLVARDTNARRPPVPGVVSNWVTTLGEAFFLAAGRALPAVLSLAGRSYRKAGRAVELRPSSPVTRGRVGRGKAAQGICELLDLKWEGSRLQPSPSLPPPCDGGGEVIARLSRPSARPRSRTGRRRRGGSGSPRSPR